MNLFDQTIPVYTQMLNALSAMLDKGAEQGGGDDILNAMLADDMHPLAVQIRFVCNMPGEAMQRLAGKGFTSREESETTVAAAQARIAEMVDYLATFSAGDLVAEDAPTELKLGNGMEFTMSAAEYVRDWAMPQFYFHLTAAYAIMRHKGVALGKADYVPYVSRYMTAGSMG